MFYSRTMTKSTHEIDYCKLARDIKRWAQALGFQKTGITDIQLDTAEQQLQQWIADGHHGEMDYMWRHGTKRSHPEQLVPGTRRVISLRMDYLPPDDDPVQVQQNPAAAFVSRYALGRDYHKTLRKRLQQLVNRITREIGEFGYRVFVDSAPVLEKPLAVKAGLGWMGKHSNIIARDAGSWFFLGEIYTDLPLPLDTEVSEHCGRCTDCIDICPTRAIVRPYVVDARRCISYLTIEHAGEIPEPLRPLIGNHVYGCDDCMLVCPWNRFARPTPERDFLPRHDLDSATLVSLFEWQEAEFYRNTEGSAIRRIGYPRWQRNLAVALGNSKDPGAVPVLQNRLSSSEPLVRQHIEWAIEQLGAVTPSPNPG